MLIIILASTCDARPFLGGQIAGDPSYVIEPDGNVIFAARGMDNALWLYDVGDRKWSSCGGIITSDPVASLRSMSNIAIVALGADHRAWLYDHDGWLRVSTCEQ
jgi:predicted proteasome-type protease